MQVVEKAFGYITREHGEQIQVLVFEQNTVGAGIQVPKGTIEEGETPLEAVKREMLEETGLTTLVVQGLIAQDYFNHPSGVLQKRYFYHLTTSDETMETWQHYPTGLNEADLLFSFYWISAEQDTLLAKGHGDYLYRLLAKVKN
ncbi:NUDIX domain-containing protein [Lysinibacillus fusiformis]|uniref:NUDIX hydrolase n=1 Tax=Lysinibacillus fusiformis TaxID=28031 RepID=UPI0000F3B103|nr:NUDIX domain-containing protein [Lysinibacillus fusiformis]EAZ83964.1 MutT/Nudix family protein [Bacillus sp. B14905]MED4076823.1 NUDIX domain-containing protein [Lysinibacillus fusiformis]NOG26893.1 NUDIX domain-containing protein [Lysinibacillus fusiformis]PCD82516.1 NUDIX domain-containing protein [Lysinibacillus fusiformis]